MVTFENLANSTHAIRTDTREDKTQQHESACDPVAQVVPCFLDWVDELSQVAGTILSDKAIGVDPVLLEACRVAGKAYRCQFAEIAKEVVSCNQFLDAWKGVIMCGVPRKPRVLCTPEQSRGIFVSTPTSTMIGKVLNKRVALAAADQAFFFLALGSRRW